MEVIGKGSFGIVKKGFDVNNQITIAVKEINLNNRIDLKELENEIQILKNLNHDHIVKYHSSKNSKNKLIIFLEYMDMGSI